MSDDYEVGYGKPPKSGQWAPGQSGNPSGSSKKAKAKKKLKTPTEMLTEVLLDPVEPNGAGKKIKMPAGLALVKLMLRDALTGSARDRREFFKLIAQPEISGLIERLIEEAENDDELPLNPAELIVLEAIRAEREAMKDTARTDIDEQLTGRES